MPADAAPDAMPHSSRLRIIVSGLVAAHPVGGMAFHYLQYAIGLAELGHDVYYHEDTWSWPYDPVRRTFSDDASRSVDFLADFVESYAPELRGRWHYSHLHRESHGMGAAAFEEVARTADVFLNVSGATMIPDALCGDCVKVFVDTDPGYNQIVLAERFDWSENVDRWCESVKAHDRHFTFAQNVASPRCRMPRLGFDWVPTRMPTVLRLWEAAARTPPPVGAPWSTVMTWNPFKGPLVYDGIEYAGKGPEFEKIMALPSRVDVPLSLAVGGTRAPLERLSASGWRTIDGPRTTLTARDYEDFIRGSRGEFSVAKDVYVALRTGWFSDRSACYLASGRPVVLQDTGLGSVLPAGEGLLLFSDLEGAVEAIERVEQDHALHRAAARRLARDHLDAGVVLEELLAAAVG